MKKILFLILALLVIALAGAVIFVVTFDADRFRPQIQQEIQNTLGQPVEIGRISLGWRSGPALEIKGFTIASSDPSRPLLSVESFGAQMDFEPLLQGRIEISSIYAEKPQIRLVRSADGTFRFLENPGASQNSSAGPATALTLLVDSIHIRDGEIIFRDEMNPASGDFVVRRLDIRLQDVSLGQSFPFDAAASFLSPVQNLKLNGKIRYLSREQAVALEDVRFETNLADLDFRELGQLMPEAASSLAGAGAGGLVTAALDPITLSADRPAEPFVRVNLTDGSYRSPAMAAPLTSIEAGLSASVREVILQGFSAEYEGSKVGVSGRMRLAKPEPEGTFQAAVTELDLSRLAPPARPRDPKPEGHGSVNLRGQFFGADSARILETVSGEGQILFNDVVIRDLNVIRELMKKLSIIPGLVQRLQERLPESYQEKLERRDTHFSPVEIPFTLASGRANFPQVMILSESFAITGSAQADLARGSLAAPMFLSIDPELSSAFIRSVQELQYLTDREGRLTIPFTAQGVMPDIRVQADVSYITSRLAVAKTQEVLSGLFDKKKEASTSASSSGTTQNATVPADSSASPAQPSAKQVLIGQLLQSVLGAPPSSDDSAQTP